MFWAARVHDRNEAAATAVPKFMPCSGWERPISCATVAYCLHPSTAQRKCYVQSHLKQVQKMLRQHQTPIKTTESTAADVPWVDSPSETEDELPVMHIPCSNIRRRVHDGSDPAHRIHAVPPESFCSCPIV